MRNRWGGNTKITIPRDNYRITDGKLLRRKKREGRKRTEKLSVDRSAAGIGTGDNSLGKKPRTSL